LDSSQDTWESKEATKTEGLVADVINGIRLCTGKV